MAHTTLNSEPLDFGPVHQWINLSAARNQPMQKKHSASTETRDLRSQCIACLETIQNPYHRAIIVWQCMAPIQRKLFSMPIGCRMLLVFAQSGWLYYRISMDFLDVSGIHKNTGEVPIKRSPSSTEVACLSQRWISWLQNGILFHNGFLIEFQCCLRRVLVCPSSRGLGCSIYRLSQSH